MAKTRVSTVRAKLNRAVNVLPLAVRIDAHARLKRYDDPNSPMRGMEVIGLVRTLHSDLQDAIGVTEPDWTLVKQFHAAWALANAYYQAENKVRHG